MSVKSQIPNLFTVGNLACGVIAIAVMFDGPRGPDKYYTIMILFVAAMLFDFVDGFVARLLKVSSPLGKQLDSLSDMVTFGVLPGLMVYYVLSRGMIPFSINITGEGAAPGWHTTILPWYKAALPYVGLLIPIFSCFRLAKFNLDTRKGDVFYGLPTPMNALFFLSIFLIFGLDGTSEAFWVLPYPEAAYAEMTGGASLQWLYHPYILPFITLTMCILMLTDYPLLAFKFKTWRFADNKFRYLLILGAVPLIVLFHYRSIPAVTVFYFAISGVAWLVERNSKAA
ncbi:MAG: CDP-alcohol phosphatidyltransferase family protein [Bacteroidota bacterium]